MPRGKRTKRVKPEEVIERGSKGRGKGTSNNAYLVGFALIIIGLIIFLLKLLLDIAAFLIIVGILVVLVVFFVRVFKKQQVRK